MKKFFTFLALTVLYTSSFAQYNNSGDRGPRFDNRNDNYRSSALSINAFTEKRFTVMVDNMQYQLNADYGRRHDNSINIAALGAGKHSITIYETRTGFFGRQKQKEVYCTSMFLKPGFETSLSINEYNQVRVSEKPMFQGNGNSYGRNDDRRDDRRGDNRRDDWNH